MGLAPSRQEYLKDDYELPFVSRPPLDYHYTGGEESGGGGSSTARPSSTSLPAGTAPKESAGEVYYYEHRVIPLTKDFFKDGNSVLSRQLWQAKHRQNPRYHFQLQDTWSPGVLLDPTSRFFHRPLLFLRSKLELLETLHQASTTTGSEKEKEGDGQADPAAPSLDESYYQAKKKELLEAIAAVEEETTKGDVPFNTCESFYQLLVNTTEENIIAEDLSLWAKKEKAEGKTKSEKVLRPVPVAVVLVREKMPVEEYQRVHFASNAQRHHANKTNSQPLPIKKKRMALVQSLRPLRLTGQDVLRAVEKAEETTPKEAMDEHYWLPVRLSREDHFNPDAELRVVGLFGLLSVKEILSHSLFLNPSESHREAREALLKRAEPHGLPADTLLPITFFEKNVGDKEMCHTFFALLREYARTLKRTLFPESPVSKPVPLETATDVLPQAPDPLYTPWQNWMESISKAEGISWSLGVPIRLSNVPLIQLCRQIRLMLTELQPTYPNGCCLSYFQDSQRLRNMTALETKRREKEGEERMGGVKRKESASTAPTDTTTTATAATAATGKGKGKLTLNVEELAPTVNPVYRNAPQSLTPEDNGVLCYADQGLIVLYVDRGAVCRSLCQIGYMPESNSIEALGVTLTAPAPQTMTYRGEVRLPLQSATTPIRESWMGKDGTQAQEFYTSAVRYRDESNFPVVRLLGGVAAPLETPLFAADLPASRLGVVLRPLVEQQRGNLLPLCASATLSKTAEEVFAVGEEWHGCTLQQLVDAVAGSLSRGDQTPDSVLGFSPLAKWQREKDRQEGPTATTAEKNTTVVGSVMVQETSEPQRVLRRGDLLRFCPTVPDNNDHQVKGYWYIDDALHAEDVILSWMRRVGGRARETKVSEIKWVRYDEQDTAGDHGMLAFIQELQPYLSEEEANEQAAVYNIARVQRFRQWRFAADGYIYFHGVTVRLPGLFSASATNPSANTISHLNNAAARGSDSRPAAVERVVPSRTEISSHEGTNLYKGPNDDPQRVKLSDTVDSESKPESRRASVKTTAPPPSAPVNGIYLDYPPQQQQPPPPGASHQDPSASYYRQSGGAPPPSRQPPRQAIAVPLPRSRQPQPYPPAQAAPGGAYYTTPPPPAQDPYYQDPRYAAPPPPRVAQVYSSPYAYPPYGGYPPPAPPPQLPVVYASPPPPQTYADPYAGYYRPPPQPMYYGERPPYAAPDPHVPPRPENGGYYAGGSPYLPPSAPQRPSNAYTDNHSASHNDSQPDLYLHPAQSGRYDSSMAEIPRVSSNFFGPPGASGGPQHQELYGNPSRHTPSPSTSTRQVEIANAVASGSQIRVRILSKQRLLPEGGSNTVGEDEFGGPGIASSSSRRIVKTHDPYSFRGEIESGAGQAVVTHTSGQSFTGGLERTTSGAADFYADGGPTQRGTNALYGGASDDVGGGEEYPYQPQQYQQQQQQPPSGGPPQGYYYSMGSR